MWLAIIALIAIVSAVSTIWGVLLERDYYRRLATPAERAAQEQRQACRDRRLALARLAQKQSKPPWPVARLLRRNRADLRASLVHRSRL